MIDIKVIASGSKGNCTAVTFGKITILLDAGIGFDRIQRALNFENPAAVFITHEHGDHAKKATIAELLKRGVNVYMSEGTAQALKLEPRHNLKYISTRLPEGYDADLEQGFIDPTQPLFDGKTYFGEVELLQGTLMSFYNAVHDAAEPVNFYFEISVEDIVAYVTDTGEVPPFVPPLSNWLPSYLIIEANHSAEALLAADIDEPQRQRILHNHLSIEKVIEYIRNGDKDFLQEVHLIHISKRHGNAEKFRQMVQAVVGEGVKVFAY